MMRLLVTLFALCSILSLPQPLLAKGTPLSTAASKALTGASKQQAPASAADEEEEDDDDGKAASGSAAGPGAKAPFSPEQLAYFKAWEKQLRASLPKTGAKGPSRLTWRAETYTKILYRNNQTQGCVGFGTPHPKGDNITGENGFCSEITLHLDGRISDRVEVGARIKSRFHRQWAEFYENGDLAIDAATGVPAVAAGVDGTGESLGMNHAAYLQLRGLYMRIRPPIPTVKTFHAGSSDLGMYNAWTVGKVRYIDRDNANGLFLDGTIAAIGLDYHFARIGLPKLFASAGWNSGIDDALIQNPFWTRDAAYVVKLAQNPTDALSWTLIGSYLIDEEADLNDPDSLGSTNFIDKKDGVVATLPRYQNANATAEVQYNRGFFDGNLLLGYSFSDPDLQYVFNGIDGNQGLSPIPMKRAHGYAIKARTDLTNLFGWGLDLRVEYFNISEDWVATFGARRETDVLLTDGFVGGQVPTLNIANEFMDWRDDWYESIIGWHGITVSPKLRRGNFEIEGEFTLLEYNTDAQDRCTRSTLANEKGVGIGATACPTDRNGNPYGVYPDFLFPDGMTDTDFYSYANTTDRGRDPRSVYKQNQARRTYISMIKGAYLFDIGRGLRWENKVKFIFDRDLRDLDISADDYAGYLFFAATRLSMPLNDELTVATGFRFDFWKEERRSGAIVGAEADYGDYRTIKTNLSIDLRYQVGGATLSWYMEWVNKDVEVTRRGAVDDTTSFAFRNVVRGIGTIATSF